MKDPPPRPSSVNPQIPSEVEQVILKALQKDPVHRHRSVTELKEELDNAVRQPVPSSSRQPAAPQVQMERSSE
jgi:eukaryotic-like serine/threonine-protein kinase